MSSTQPRQTEPERLTDRHGDEHQKRESSVAIGETNRDGQSSADRHANRERRAKGRPEQMALTKVCDLMTDHVAQQRVWPVQQSVSVGHHHVWRRPL